VGAHQRAKAVEEKGPVQSQADYAEPRSALKVYPARQARGLQDRYSLDLTDARTSSACQSSKWVVRAGLLPQPVMQGDASHLVGVLRLYPTTAWQRTSPAPITTPLVSAALTTGWRASSLRRASILRGLRRPSRLQTLLNKGLCKLSFKRKFRHLLHVQGLLKP